MPIGIEEFMKTATDDQKKLLFELAELANQEKIIAIKINNIYKSVESGIYSPDGISVTVCKNEDDAIVISSDHRQELRTIRSKICALLKKAVDIGMKDVGIIQRQIPNYTLNKMV